MDNFMPFEMMFVEKIFSADFAWKGLFCGVFNCVSFESTWISKDLPARSAWIWVGLFT